MNEKTLEKELTERIEQHKFNILKMRIKKHYEDLYNTGIVIPIFMLESPEKMAIKEVSQLKKNDYEEFNRLYEVAWWEYAEKID